jgi:hypothetical protein
MALDSDMSAAVSPGSSAAHSGTCAWELFAHAVELISPVLSKQGVDELWGELSKFDSLKCQRLFKNCSVRSAGGCSSESGLRVGAISRAL